MPCMMLMTVCLYVYRRHVRAHTDHTVSALTRGFLSFTFWHACTHKTHIHTLSFSLSHTHSPLLSLSPLSLSPLSLSLFFSFSLSHSFPSLSLHPDLRLASCWLSSFSLGVILRPAVLIRSSPTAKPPPLWPVTIVKY